jgi:hypothetical protein
LYSPAHPVKRSDTATKAKTDSVLFISFNFDVQNYSFSGEQQRVLHIFYACGEEFYIFFAPKGADFTELFVFLHLKKRRQRLKEATIALEKALEEVVESISWRHLNSHRNTSPQATSLRPLPV